MSSQTRIWPSPENFWAASSPYPKTYGAPEFCIWQAQGRGVWHLQISGLPSFYNRILLPCLLVDSFLPNSYSVGELPKASKHCLGQSHHISLPTLRSWLLRIASEFFLISESPPFLPLLHVLWVKLARDIWNMPKVYVVTLISIFVSSVVGFSTNSVSQIKLN